MDIVNTVFKPWTGSAECPYVTKFKEENRGSDLGLRPRFVSITGKDGKLYTDETNLGWGDEAQYKTLYDTKSGYFYTFCCPFGMWIRGFVFLAGSLARPFMSIGVEIADTFTTGQLKLIERIKNIARAVWYMPPMVLASLGMLIPFCSATFMQKIAEIERNANQGVHFEKSLRKPEDRGKFALYITALPRVFSAQPRGHIDQITKNGPKYRLWNFNLKVEPARYGGRYRVKSPIFSIPNVNNIVNRLIELTPKIQGKGVNGVGFTVGDQETGAGSNTSMTNKLREYACVYHLTEENGVETRYVGGCFDRELSKKQVDEFKDLGLKDARIHNTQDVWDALERMLTLEYLKV